MKKHPKTENISVIREVSKVQLIDNKKINEEVFEDNFNR